MNRYIALIFSLLLVCFQGVALGSTVLEDKVFEHRFDNGLKLLVVERHDTPVVSAYITIGVGSVHETSETRGVAHLLASALQHLGHSPDHPAKPAMIARFEHHYETAHGLTRLYPNVPASLHRLQQAGLGLAICRRILQTMEATILARAGENGGLEIEIRFPFFSNDN